MVEDAILFVWNEKSACVFNLPEKHCDACSMQVSGDAFPRFDDLIFVTCGQGTSSIHHRNTPNPLPLGRPVETWLSGARNLFPDLQRKFLFYRAGRLPYQIHIRVERWRTFVSFNGQCASHFCNHTDCSSEWKF